MILERVYWQRWTAGKLQHISTRTFVTNNVCTQSPHLTLSASLTGNCWQRRQKEKLVSPKFSELSYLYRKGALRGTVERLDDQNNGKYFGILELLAESSSLTIFRYSEKVSGRRGAVTSTLQNSLLNRCGQKVRQFVITECLAAYSFP